MLSQGGHVSFPKKASQMTLIVEASGESNLGERQASVEQTTGAVQLEVRPVSVRGKASG